MSTTISAVLEGGSSMDSGRAGRMTVGIDVCGEGTTSFCMLISQFRLPFADLNFHKTATAGVYNLARDGLISGRISSAEVPHQALANTQFLTMGRVRRNGGGAKSGSLKRNRLVYSLLAEGPTF